MTRLTRITILLFLITLPVSARKSPHGDKFNMDCLVCHSTADWHKIKKGFDHNTTRFPLTGQHRDLDCRKCHTSLEFNKVKTRCFECHTDVHQGTVGNDCERCHNTSSWLIRNVRQIHQQAGFPLRGSHATADCRQCHRSASTLRFDNVNTDCYTCHKKEYASTFGTKNDHQALGFDTDCAHCHNNTGMSWDRIGKGFDHSYFPLVGGHNLECTQCHIDGNYRVKLSTDCASCHSGKKAEAMAAYPAHRTVFAKFSCGECHTAYTWNTVKMKQHDSWWGIYSGHHKGAWSTCTDCHVNDTGWDAKNTCSRCHGNSKHF